MIDLGILIIIAVFMLVGYMRGLVRSVFGLLGTAVSVVAVAVLHPVLLPHTLNSPVGNIVRDFVIKLLSFMGIRYMEAEAVSNSTILSLNDIAAVVKNQVEQAIASMNNNLTETLVNTFSNTLISILIILAVFFGVKLIMFILLTTFEYVADHPFIKKINKIGGLIFGFLEGFALIYLILFVLSLGVGAWLPEQLEQILKASIILRGFLNF